MKNTVIGILAHVDAGKTTLAESILYTCQKIRKPGRVDHGDTVLDHYAVERERGITVFSKQAQITYGGRNFTLLDTPGHVDFSVETERTLNVLDAAILVISAKDRVQAHTLTLWRFLRHYHVPVFLFVNKMDQPGNDPDAILSDLRNRLDSQIISFPSAPEEGAKHTPSDDVWYDELSMCNEEMMESFLENGVIETSAIAAAVSAREVFPVYYGSALHLQGIKALLNGIATYLPAGEKATEDVPFSGRVFKISRENGTRLTHVRITAGTLQVKDALTYGEYTEKINQIRIYHGSDFYPVEKVSAGDICCLTGPNHTVAGQGLGADPVKIESYLMPVLTYQVIPPSGTDPVAALEQLRSLNEEIPELNVTWKENSAGIHVQVMGEVQIEKIYASTYKQSKEDLLPYRDDPNRVKVVSGNHKEKPYRYQPIAPKEEYVFVDGYNVIFASDELHELAKRNIDSARDALIDKCCNYQGYRGCRLILVFDAYRVRGNPGSLLQYRNITVVYTKESELADTYIERGVGRLAKKADVTVATSDALEQSVVWGYGARRMSSRDFLKQCDEPPLPPPG